MFKNDVYDLFNYVCDDVLIDDFEYMTIECKWQVILTDSGYIYIINLVCGRLHASSV